MDNNLEQIALDALDSVRHLTEAAALAKQLNSFGDEKLSTVSKNLTHCSELMHEKALKSFWKTFKYPLQIFDLKKNQEPYNGEKVFVFDEKENRWIELSFDFDEKQFYFAWNHTVYNVNFFHRWTRLPILEQE